MPGPRSPSRRSRSPPGDVAPWGPRKHLGLLWSRCPLAPLPHQNTGHAPWQLSCSGLGHIPAHGSRMAAESDPSQGICRPAGILGTARSESRNIPVTHSRADWEPQGGVQAWHSQNPIPGTQGWSQSLSLIVSCSGSSCSRLRAVWPPGSPHEPPQPHCPGEVHWVLLGLPGKQLLFCSSLVLAQAVAGSRSISLSTGVGCSHSRLSSGRMFPPLPTSQTSSCCFVPACSCPGHGT